MITDYLNIAANSSFKILIRSSVIFFVGISGVFVICSRIEYIRLFTPVIDVATAVTEAWAALDDGCCTCVGLLRVYVAPYIFFGIPIIRDEIIIWL